MRGDARVEAQEEDVRPGHAVLLLPVRAQIAVDCERGAQEAVGVEDLQSHNICSALLLYMRYKYAILKCGILLTVQ